ncbi:MAG: Ig-like domain-containing protein [Candidatus Magasanikbacteria bacterium]
MLPWIRSSIHIYKKAVLSVCFFVLIFVGIGFNFTSHVAYAQEDTLGIDVVEDQDQGNIALGNADIRIVVVKIIRVALGLLGIVTVGLIVYAGFVIMLSGGNEERIAYGKKIMINAVIGLVIIFSAFAIVQFVLNALGGRTQQGPPGGRRPPGLQTFSGSGALGRVVKDHYPFRDQNGVARNTSIVVTFALPVDTSSFIENSNNTCWSGINTSVPCDATNNRPYFGDCFDANNDGMTSWQTECDRLNTSTIKIDTHDKVDERTDRQSDSAGIGAAALASYDVEGNAYTFVFKPYEYLGSAEREVAYTVDLGEEIKKQGKDESIFSSLFNKFYTWDFSTDTRIDLDPPHVIDVYPASGTTEKKNNIIQITFDEAIDPTTVQGYYTPNPANGFDNILVNTEIGGAVASVTGTWSITNGYRTIEFITDNPCGQNSCGDMMYCLEVDCTGLAENCTKPYQALIRTAQSTQNADAPFEAIPFSGVYDLAFNGLDNITNEHIAPDDPQRLNKQPKVVTPSKKVVYDSEKRVDNYWWGFNIINEIDRSAPYVEEVVPGVDGQDVAERDPLYISFSKRMKLSTMDNVELREHPERVCFDAAFDTSTPKVCLQDERMDDIWFKVFSNIINDKTKSEVRHRDFGPNSLDLYYFPSVPSSVKSVTQNCIYPGYGPWQQNRLPNGTTPSPCLVSYDSNGNVTSASGCVNVSASVSTTDTGCAYTYLDMTSSSDLRLLKPDVAQCLGYLTTQSESQYQ